MTENIVDIELKVRVILTKVNDNWWEVGFVTEHKIPEKGKFMTTKDINDLKRRFGV